MAETFQEQLPREVAAWQEERLISEGQARALLARYGLVEGELEARRSGLVTALAFLGALLVGIGVITFLAANWAFVPGWSKLLLIFAAVILAYGTGYWMRYEREWSPRVGNALIFLGALLFGAAIFLIAQGFHIRADEATLLYLWVLGVLPMAYLLGAPSMVALAVVAFAIGLGWELDDLGAWFLPALGRFLMLGILLYALGELHRQSERGRALQPPYTMLGLFLVLGVLYVLSFSWVWEEGWGQSAHGAFSFASPFGRRLGALALAALLFNGLHWLRARGAAAGATAWESLGVFLLLGAAWVVAAAGPSLARAPGSFYPPAAIVANLLLFAVTMGLIALGALEHRPALVNTGILFFGAHLFTRYFDIFGRLLHTSVVFIGAGLLLLFGGMALERARRRLIDPAEAPFAATEGGER
jgi:uncharacterized membrane protein